MLTNRQADLLLVVIELESEETCVPRYGNLLVQDCFGPGFRLEEDWACLIRDFGGAGVTEHGTRFLVE